MKAICIKDGRMVNTQRRFCLQGKIYKFRIMTGARRFPYRVDSEFSHNHEMGEGFFKSYFRPCEDHFLPENLFDI
jgi:hypothetical protein